MAYIALFLSIGISTITLIILLVFCLIKTPFKEILKTLRENPFCKIMVCLYLFQVIGLLYTTNFNTGLFELEKKASFLLIPLLVLPLFQKESIDDDVIFKRIGYITLISSLVLLCIATFKNLVLKDPQAFYFENFTSIPVHYVYYSMYFACGSLFLIDVLFDTLVKKEYGVFIIILLFVYSLGFLILIASKTGIIAFGLTAMFFLYKKIQSKTIFGLSLVMLFMSASLILYFNDTTRSRFTELSQNLSILTRDKLGDEVITDLNMRLLFWKISIVHSWRDHLVLTGVGTGDAQDYLDSVYSNPNYRLYGYIGWDSHNQWVFTFIQLGLLGIFVMAVLYAKYFKEAFGRNDLKFITFLIITFGFSLSESILESNKGIVFFSLLFTLLCVSYKKQLPA
jgi:hypothetical protein